ncbi:hypothetical protein [Aeromonas dhakensis]|uniref:hypothetical protein n=1 Tax=Aeromonas dhakensis TaxID=196024 RepID=UPI001FCBFB5E|nr:hypothetical protein [Aeromonas dhakensis]MCJ2367949.1 hypothetical protein [Aeromonas dhakensis]
MISLMNRCAVLISLCVVSTSVFSSVMPSETELELGGKKGSHHIVRIFNQSDSIAYVKIDDIVRVDQPSTPDQKEVLVNNVKNPELMVTPLLLVIQPKSDGDVIVVDMVNHRDTEQAYYFTVKQVSAHATKGISMMVNYRVLVHAEPNVFKSKLLSEQKQKNIVLKNTGNVRYALRDVKWCRKDEDQRCINIKGNNSFRIYPNMEKLLPKRTGYDLHFVEIYPSYQEHTVKG